VLGLRFAGVLLGTAALFHGNLGLACGDKLLSIGRGIRIQQVYGRRPANVVIYSDANGKGASITSAKVQNTLRQAGHKLQTVVGLSQLDKALESEKVDVVLADVVEAAALSRHLQSSPSKPIMVPVLFKPSKAEHDAAEREYGYALKASGDDIQYLSAIHEAMKIRLKAGKS
jgi:ABC-type amino acid transport substrate-binding protein